MSDLLTTIRAAVAALNIELTTAAHSAGDALTMLRATRAAERHLSATLQAIYDAHDLTIGIPAQAPRERRRAA